MRTAFFTPAVLSGVPNLVSPGEADAANGLLQAAERISTAVGPVIGGALVAAAGPHPVYWINAATFLVSASLILAIPGRLLQSERPITRGHWGDLAEGYAAVRRSPELLTVLVAWTVAVVANAFFNTAEIFLVRSSYGAGDFGFGLMWTASGAGMVAGALFAPGWISRHELRRVYAWVLAVFALGIGVGIVPMAVAGLANGAAIVCNIGLIQRGAPDAVRGRAFTLIISVNYALMLVALLLAGPLTNALGGRWVAGIAAVTLAAATVAGALLVRRVEEQAPAVAEAA